MFQNYELNKEESTEENRVVIGKDVLVSDDLKFLKHSHNAEVAKNLKRSHEAALSEEPATKRKRTEEQSHAVLEM